MFGRAATANATLAAINSRKVRLEIRLVGFYCSLDRIIVDHTCNTPLLTFNLYFVLHVLF